jgi:hypothetical protein
MLVTQDLAGFCDGKEVTVELFEIGPGTSGKHYPVFINVSGSEKARGDH